MRVFVDACVDPRIVEILSDHDASTAFDLGWQNIKDHILLPKVADAGFDVFLTADRGFEFEHNLRRLPICIVIVHTARNKLADYRAIAAELRASIGAAKPGKVFHVPVGG
jgi:hypothetical protein